MLPPNCNMAMTRHAFYYKNMPSTHSKNFPGKILFANSHVRKILFAYNGPLKNCTNHLKTGTTPVNIKWFVPKKTRVDTLAPPKTEGQLSILLTSKSSKFLFMNNYSLCIISLVIVCFFKQLKHMEACIVQ